MNTAVVVELERRLRTSDYSRDGLRALLIEAVVEIKRLQHQHLSKIAQSSQQILDAIQAAKSQ